MRMRLFVERMKALYEPQETIAAPRLALLTFATALVERPMVEIVDL